jgi:hypothetical protein
MNPVFQSAYGDDLLAELISVLKPHPKGLRRWSVMRTMRDNRKRLRREIPLKFELDVERLFQKHCVSDKDMSQGDIEQIPFFRPRETAGEVWALRAAGRDVPTPGETPPAR